MFPDDAAAEAWFAERRWPTGVCCAHCGSLNVQTGAKHPTMPYRCREKECRKRFSVKHGTVMQSSKLGYQVWAVAVYLLTTNLKGVSSMKLHRDLRITQKSAWHLAHRIRAAMEQVEGRAPMAGPVEADESYFGGKRRNMSNAKRKSLKRTGRGAVGKAAVAGLKDRATNEVRAKVVDRTDADTLQGFVAENTGGFATVYTDDAGAYQNLPFLHASVKHSVGEFVKGQAHTNGVESFWSGLKRAHKGTFHKFSQKHLDRYVREFSGRHNSRELDTLAQMGRIAARMVSRRLRYGDLIADNGRSSGARG